MLRGVKLAFDRILSRVLVAAVLGTGLIAAAGCPSSAAKPVVQQPPTGGDPLFTADGKHFAASRTYQGECMPAGSRGGCYSITLEPDGSYRHVLLDAAVSGTYAIAGDDVSLTPDGDMPPQTMTLSADRSRLGDFAYQAPSAD